jgi:hypothetical protein
MKTSFWENEIRETAATLKLQAALARIETSNARSRADAVANLAAAEKKTGDWRAVLAAGQGASDRLSHAREHHQILRDRHAVAVARFDKLVGGFDYSRSWFVDLQKFDPLKDNAAFGSVTNFENPFVFYAREMSALEAGIARIESRLPEFEKIEADAREAAIRYAKANDIDHDFNRESL